MREFLRRFKSSFDRFITDWVAPGMIGFAPMLLPLRDPVPPDEYHEFENTYRTQFTDINIPYQRIARALPWTRLPEPAIEEPN
jgi:hypothetical protein